MMSQIKIGDNPQTINPYSMLELEGTDRAFVLTRVTTAQMNDILPLRGAMVYNIDEKCVFQFDGTRWRSLCTENTDDQEISDFTFDPLNNELTLTLEDGGTKTVSIDEFKIKAGSDGEILTTVGTNVEWTKHIGAVAESYLTSNPQEIGNTFTDVVFGNSGVVDGTNFTTSNTSITITRPGVYKITYRVSLEFKSGNNRSESEFQLTQNGIIIPGSTAFGKHRNSRNNKDTATATRVIEVSGTAPLSVAIAVQAKKVTGGATLQTVVNATTFLIEKQ
ncbi:MAG: hypothetical protein COB81_01460 [Flavobacteriaceae bacterium]|nr:MAG: hypothetical protein COB81_01460 [Flavobacteriaceae bacterium]